MNQRLLSRSERRTLGRHVLYFLAKHVATTRGMAQRFGYAMIQIASVLLSLHVEGVVEPIGIVAKDDVGPGEFLWGLTFHGQFHGVQDECGQVRGCAHCRKTFAEW